MCCAVLCLLSQSCPTLCNPMNCSPPGFLCPWDSPGKNTGVGCHVLSRGSSQPRERTQISLTAGSSSSFKPPGLVISRMLSQTRRFYNLPYVSVGEQPPGLGRSLKPPFSSLLGPCSLIPVLAVGFEMSPKTLTLRLKGI